jgi:hypothetical protein
MNAKQEARKIGLVFILVGKGNPTFSTRNQPDKRNGRPTD